MTRDLTRATLRALGFGGGVRPQVNTEPHEVTNVCRDIHCYGCDVDEPFTGPAYRVCPECYHRYPTARSLRRDYRREALRIHLDEIRHPTTAYTELTPPGGPPGDAVPLADAHTVWPRHPRLDALRHLAALPFVRAATIRFCQRCLHDF